MPQEDLKRVQLHIQKQSELLLSQFNAFYKKECAPIIADKPSKAQYSNNFQ